MTRKKANPAKPWAKKKGRDRDRKLVGSKEDKWAEQIGERVLEMPHPLQLEAVTDPALLFTWLVGRGGGKTTAFKFKYAREMARTPGGRYLYVAPTLGMATELLWDPFKDICHELGIEADFKERDLGGKTCTFLKNGARLRLVGADDRREMDKQRGQPFNGVGVDEAALFPPEQLRWFYERIIAPRLGERHGWFGMASTPGHELYGMFYELTSDGSDEHRPYREREHYPADWKKCSSHRWSLRDVAALPNATRKYPAIVANYLTALEHKTTRGWSDDNPIWMREYLGLWAADNTENIYRYRAHLPSGEAWNQWDPPRDPITGFAKLPEQFTDWQFGYGQDMGSKDPYALNIFAFSPSDPSRTLYHVLCFGRTGMYARTIANVMLGEETVGRILKGEQVDYTKIPAGTFAVTGWPAACVADFAALGEAVADELKNVYGIRIKPAEKKGKHSAIEGVNGDLVDGRIKILRDSPLEKQLQQLQWKRDEYGQVKEGKGDRNDHTDSLIYLRREVVGLFASGVVVPPAQGAPAAPTVFSDPMGLGAPEQVSDEDSMLAPVDFDDWGNG